jgi:hypothetical protein
MCQFVIAISAGGNGGFPFWVWARLTLRSAPHRQQRKFKFKSYFFCDLKPNAKFENHTVILSGRKVPGREREREKRKNAVNHGDLVL